MKFFLVASEATTAAFTYQPSRAWLYKFNSPNKSTIFAICTNSSLAISFVSKYSSKPNAIASLAIAPIVATSSCNVACETVFSKNPSSTLAN